MFGSAAIQGRVNRKSKLSIAATFSKYEKMLIFFRISGLNFESRSLNESNRLPHRQK